MQKKFIYAFWVLVILLVSFAIHHYLKSAERKRLTPQSYEAGKSAVVVIKADNHQYRSYGFINRQRVVFLVDTSATGVSIPEAIANRANLKKGYAFQASTANGIITVYHTVIPRLEIGEIVLTDVMGNINPSMQGTKVLLGMSALKQLEIIQRQNRLILRQSEG